MISRSNKALLLMAIAFAAVLCVHGVKAYRILGEKTLAQQAVTESVRKWKENYLALGTSVQRWVHDYRREDSVQDLMSLFAVVNLADYGLFTNADTIILNKIEPVIQGGRPIGLTRICLTSTRAGEAGALQVEAANYQALFAGIKRLAQRPDIHIGTIGIRGDKPTPLGYLGEFCVQLSKN